MRNLESTLKLEQAADWAVLRPADTSPEVWAAVGTMLRSLPAEKFAPWGSYADLVHRLAAIPPARFLDCPEPVLAAAAQLACDASGIEAPAWLWRPVTSDEEADAIVNDLEAMVAKITGPDAGNERTVLEPVRTGSVKRDYPEDQR
jgi:hypothetical protein